MANLEQMSRVLYSHIWDDVRQWAVAIEHLADLSDMEIAVLAAERPHCFAGPTGAALGEDAKQRVAEL
jgi:hypothetical protein